METSESSRLPARYQFREFRLTDKRKVISAHLFAQLKGDNHSKKFHAALRKVEASLCRLDEDIALMLRWTEGGPHRINRGIWFTAIQ